MTIESPTYLQSPIAKKGLKIRLKKWFLPRNRKSKDLQRVDIISVSHSRQERKHSAWARDKFEHWNERIKTLHFTSLDKIKIEKYRSYDIMNRWSKCFSISSVIKTFAAVMLNAELPAMEIYRWNSTSEFILWQTHLISSRIWPWRF